MDEAVEYGDPVGAEPNRDVTKIVFYSDGTHEVIEVKN